MTTFEINQDAPPEKFVAHIIKTSALSPGESDSKIRSIIADTWLRARREEVADVKAAALRYIEVDDFLERKLEHARRVILNTITKRNLVTPKRFQWVHGWHSYIISGFYRNVADDHESPRFKPLMVLRLAGMLETFPGEDFVKVYAEGRPNYEFIPLNWLELSEGELSKMVRDEVRNDADKNHMEKLKALRSEKEIAEKKVRSLQTQIDELTPKKA